MRKLSSILKDSSNLKSASSEVDFKELVFEKYNIVNEYKEDFDNASKIIKEPKELEKSTLKQENIIDLDVDDNMIPFFEMLDILSAFRVFSNLYQQERGEKLKWIDTEIIKSLNSINYYVEQLASYISLDAEDIEIDLEFPRDGFDNNKRLDTLFKQTEELKTLRKIVKKGIDFSNQSLTVRAIAASILNKVKSFLKIV